MNSKVYEINNLSFSYNKKPVFENVNLSVDNGEVITVLGKNGVGKSTLFSCMLGLLKPSEGNILLFGKDLSKMKRRDISSLVSFVPQNHASSFGYTVYEYVLMGAASKTGLFSHPSKEDEKNAREAIEKMGIEALSDRIYTELSGGEKQQVCIARAISTNPKVILFDEPTAHLDMDNQIKVLRIIKELSTYGFSVLVTTHDPNHSILLGGSVFLFDNRGNVEKGSVEDLIKEEKLSGIFGTDLKVQYVEQFKRKICSYLNI